MKLTFCWQAEMLEQSRHFESKTNTYAGSLNVTLSLDTVTIHMILGHLIHGSRIENGISHWTSATDTSRASVKNTSKVNCISWNVINTTLKNLVTVNVLIVKLKEIANRSGIYQLQSHTYKSTGEGVDECEVWEEQWYKSARNKSTEITHWTCTWSSDYWRQTRIDWTVKAQKTCNTTIAHPTEYVLINHNFVEQLACCWCSCWCYH